MGFGIWHTCDQGPTGFSPLEEWGCQGVGPMAPKIVTKRPLRPQSLKPLPVRGEILLVSRSSLACFRGRFANNQSLNTVSFQAWVGKPLLAALVLRALLMSRSILVCFLEGEWPKINHLRVSSRIPGVVAGPLLVSRSIFVCFLEGNWPKFDHERLSLSRLGLASLF